MIWHLILYTKSRRLKIVKRIIDAKVSLSKSTLKSYNIIKLYDFNIYSKSTVSSDWVCATTSLRRQLTLTIVNLGSGLNRLGGGASF